MSNNRISILALLFGLLAAAAPQTNAQSVVRRARLSAYAEDLTYMPLGSGSGQIVVLDGYDVLAVPGQGNAPARKLFDCGKLLLSSNSPRGIAYIQSRGVFVVNDPYQTTTLYLVDKKGEPAGEIHVQYPGDVPSYPEAIAYIPSDSEVFPDHLAMIVGYRSTGEQRLDVFKLSGEVVLELFVPPEVSIVGLDFKPPNHLLVTGQDTEAYESFVVEVDFTGKAIADPVMIDVDYPEGIVLTPGGTAYVVGGGGKLYALRSDLVRLPEADRTYMEAMGFDNPSGLAWNSDTDQHVISDWNGTQTKVELTGLPFNFNSATSSALGPERLRPGDLTFLPDFHLMAMGVQSRGTPGTPNYIPPSIGLFDAEGALDHLIDLRALGMGTPPSISYIPTTQEFVVSFGASIRMLHILSLSGTVVRTLDLTSTPIEYVAEVEFFNPGHPSGGQFLIFEYPRGGPTGSHLAIVTDFDGNVLSQFDYLKELGVWWPYDVAAITSGPLSGAGAFSVLDYIGREAVVFLLQDKGR